jgi:type II secretory pathway component PulF
MMTMLMTMLAEGFFAFEWWQWLFILVLVGLVVMLVVMRRKGQG